jgi:hypothetical protein
VQASAAAGPSAADVDVVGDDRFEEHAGPVRIPDKGEFACAGVEVLRLAFGPSLPANPRVARHTSYRTR